MGAWGYGIFENDQDMDAVDDLSSLCGVESLNDWEEYDSMVKVLNAGGLNTAFDKLRFQRPHPKYEIMILGACAMRMGANIEAKHIKSIRRCIPELEKEGISSEIADQMKTACMKYKNGTPWDFGVVGLLETASAEDRDTLHEYHNIDREAFPPKDGFKTKPKAKDTKEAKDKSLPDPSSNKD